MCENKFKVLILRQKAHKIPLKKTKGRGKRQDGHCVERAGEDRLSTHRNRNGIIWLHGEVMTRFKQR